MKKGYLPTVSIQVSVGKRVKVELHHKQPISENSEIYDQDNLNAVTSKRHIEIHKGK
ncbi:HNH endonuclease [Pseudocitrobacter sp. RIT415]|uniref:HNH endonuclease n=1 Tax=Pseudocitrobacter sp. RIT415 TaxID=2202163 RepID=UPI000D3C5D9D|nr:HNH endonuclease [Pseudocitrobacter sp. RIT 415]